MTLSNVSAAYSARSSEYIGRFGSIDTVAPMDRESVIAWARELTGPVIDVGCGPGQWTHLLSELGLDVEGIDPTPEFVASAQRQFPDVRFRIAQAEHLGAANESLGAILAWYSLIHIEPELIDAALTEFARCLRPGGGLALGFFEGPEIAAFEHAVTTAYFWPIERLRARLEACGFVVTDTQTRTDSGARRHGLITATLGTAAE